MTTDLLPSVESLGFYAADASRTADWQELYTRGAVRTWEPIEEYEHDGVTYTLLTDGGTVIGVVLNGEFTEFRDLVTDEDDEDYDGIPEDVVSVLKDVEPYRYGAEGPMMNYWYPFEKYEFDPASEAAKLVHLPLCIVEVDDDFGSSFGLALTGGGMDLSWEIAEAFVRLGMYPPPYVTSLPRMAGYRANEARKRVVEAMMKRNEVSIGHLTYQNEDLDRLLVDLDSEKGL